MTGEDETPPSYEELLVQLLSLLRRLPAPVRRKMEGELRDLLALLRDRRPPRLLLVGRRGSGKSTLLNAVFGRRVAEVGAVRAQTGAARWCRYERDGRAADILDTRGVQEGGGPAEAMDAETPRESIRQAVQESPPDAVLFLIKAKEVDAAVAGDLEALEGVLADLDRAHGGSTPLVAVLTQCDELDPPDVRRLPADDATKNAHIQQAEQVLREHIESRAALAPRLVRVVPTVAYARYRADGSIDPERDYRWHIDALVGFVLDELPDDAKLDFARLARVRRYQKQVAQRVISVCAGVAGGIGAQPIPLADMPILTTLQALMITAVAYVAGRDLTAVAARDFLVSLGVVGPAALGFREVARGLVKLVPGFGNAISGAVAASGTLVVGRAAIAYFIDEASVAQARRLLRKRRAPAGEPD